jgi:hypothetical protein
MRKPVLPSTEVMQTLRDIVSCDGLDCWGYVMEIYWCHAAVTRKYHGFLYKVTTCVMVI